MSSSDTPTEADILEARNKALGKTVQEPVQSYGADPQGIYQDLFLNNPAVCRNCFREVRIERESTESRTGRSDVSVTKSDLTLHPLNVSVEYVPAQTVQGSRRSFCQCCVDSAFVRVWDSSDLDTAKLANLSANLVTTAVSLGVLDCSEHETVHECIHSGERTRTRERTRTGAPARTHARARTRTPAPGCAPAHAHARARRGWSKFSSEDFASEQRRGGVADHIFCNAISEAVAIQAARKPNE